MKTPWDNPFTRAMNKTLEKPVSQKPHRGHVDGTGDGQKLSQHFGVEDMETRK